MADDATYLSAITNTPNDRGLRLSYGVWLEEQRDPRGELVRIEEALRDLPVFGDDYWRLRPRRDELRLGINPDWLRSMRYGTDSSPIFRHGWPDGWKERWRLIREHATRWHRLPLGDVGGRSDEVSGIETRLGRRLPPSVREWVAFAYDVRQQESCHDVLRDVYEMQELDGHSAVSLLVQCEEDLYYAIRQVDLTLPDPPVHWFRWDGKQEQEKTLIADTRNPVFDTLTEFVLHYSLV